MRVLVEGEQRGRAVRYTWDLLDRFDERTGLRSMSRTTAFPATIVARLVAAGRFRRPGVHAPEAIGAEDGLLDAVLGELLARGVRCQAKLEQLAPAPELAGQPA
jgi:saccharopine dehydrogenase-like NADP-dependent oxidoreductase